MAEFLRVFRDVFLICLIYRMPALSDFTHGAFGHVQWNQAGLTRTFLAKSRPLDLPAFESRPVANHSRLAWDELLRLPFDSNKKEISLDKYD